MLKVALDEAEDYFEAAVRRSKPRRELKRRWVEKKSESVLPMVEVVIQN